MSPLFAVGGDIVKDPIFDFNHDFNFTQKRV